MHDSNGCLSLDGDDVYFETHGAPDAPVVVLGHGAGGNHGIWFQQVPVFARRLPRRHVGPTRLRQLDEPQRAREPAHRDRRPARDPRPPRRRARARRRPVDGRLGRDGARARARRSCAQPRARRHARRHPGRRLVEGRGVDRAARRSVQPPRARRTSSASRNPERAHLYLQIGGLRRDPLADQSADAAAPGRRHVHRRRSSRALELPTLFIVGTEDEIFPPALDRRRPRRGCPAPGSSRSPAPATRRISSSPTRGTPWSQDFWFPADLIAVNNCLSPSRILGEPSGETRIRARADVSPTVHSGQPGTRSVRARGNTMISVVEWFAPSP